jgi:hypothetical protein
VVRLIHVGYGYYRDFVDSEWRLEYNLEMTVSYLKSIRLLDSFIITTRSGEFNCSLGYSLVQNGFFAILSTVYNSP